MRQFLIMCVMALGAAALRIQLQLHSVSQFAVDAIMATHIGTYFLVLALVDRNNMRSPK